MIMVIEAETNRVLGEFRGNDEEFTSFWTWEDGAIEYAPTDEVQVARMTRQQVLANVNFVGSDRL